METIIVPTDFSAAANNAIEYAVDLAKYFDARIVLTNAYPLPLVAYETPYANESISSLHKNSHEKLLIAKHQILEKHGYDFKVECYSGMGSPYEIIQEAAKEKRADLIVMGVKEQPGNWWQRLVGSTAVDVARKIETPTLMIPENVKYHRIHKISFACDLEKTEETDLVYRAKFFSRIFDAELEVINVGSPLKEITQNQEKTFFFIEKKLEPVKHKITHLIGEDVAEELEDYFTVHPVDMLLLNPKKHNFLYNLFNNSITRRLVRHSRLPLLAIH